MLLLNNKNTLILQYDIFDFIGLKNFAVSPLQSSGLTF